MHENKSFIYGSHWHSDMIIEYGTTQDYFSNCDYQEQNTAAFIKQHTKEIVPTLTPHIHAEIIHAFADGYVIEVQDTNGEWSVACFPAFLANRKYRKKHPAPDRVFPTTSLTEDELEVCADISAGHIDYMFTEVANAAIKQYILDTEK